MRWKPARIVRLTVILVLLQASVIVGDAADQPSGQELQLRYSQQSLQISARNADLKQVLAQLASIADITVVYPTALEKRITLNRRGISIRDALDAMLIGINHIIFYSGPDPEAAHVTKVEIFGKKAAAQPSSARQKQLARRIASYRRQISSLQKRLSTIDADSNRGRRYTNRIRRLEQTVERLKRQSY